METNTDELQNEQSKKGAGFFSVFFSALRDIAMEFKKPEHVATYIVLSRHAQNSGELPGLLSTAGIQAVSNKARISRRTAEFVLGELENHGFIASIENNTDPEIPLFRGKIQGRRNSIRWIFDKKYLGGDRVYFPNAITDGIARGKDNPPLCKIMSVPGVIRRNPSDARLDALMVLTNLYYHHELFDCGGVDPMKGLYKKWGVANTVITEADGYIDTLGDLTFVELDNDSTDTKTVISDLLIDTSLEYIEDVTERETRFNEAFKTLSKELCYLYEVLQIWNMDPTVNRYAEVLYPLYVFDSYKREKESYLQKVINSAAMKLTEEAPEYFNDCSGGCDPERNNKFIFVEDASYRAFPLSVFRLKYVPNTKDAACWIEREKASIEEWTERISYAKQQ